MLLAGTTFTELDQAASFWFAVMGTWRGGAPPHLRPHTCSRQLCELPPVTAPASTGPTDLPSLLARRRKRHPDLSRPEAEPASSRDRFSGEWATQPFLRSRALELFGRRV